MSEFVSKNIFDVNATPEKIKQVIPVKALGNVGLVRIVDVRLDPIEFKEVNEKGIVSKNEYVGLKGSRFTVEFEGIPYGEDKEQRNMYMNESVIVSIKKDGLSIDTKTLINLYKGLWDKLLHIYKANKDLPNYKDMPEVPSDCLPHPEMPVNVRIEAFGKLFKHVADAMKTGKDGINPIYFVDGKAAPAYLKIVAKGKRFEIPSYVGTGFYEVVKFNGDNMISTRLEIKPDDSLTLVVDSKDASGGYANQMNNAANTKANENIPKADVNSIMDKYKKQ